jgi:hypothetical protein
MEKSLWIGLIGIIPKPGNECFGGANVFGTFHMYNSEGEN